MRRRDFRALRRAGLAGIAGLAGLAFALLHLVSNAGNAGNGQTNSLFPFLSPASTRFLSASLRTSNACGIARVPGRLKSSDLRPLGGRWRAGEAVAAGSTTRSRAGPGAVHSRGGGGSGPRPGRPGPTRG